MLNNNLFIPLLPIAHTAYPVLLLFGQTSNIVKQYSFTIQIKVNFSHCLCFIYEQLHTLKIHPLRLTNHPHLFFSLNSLTRSWELLFLAYPLPSKVPLDHLQCTPCPHHRDEISANLKTLLDVVGGKKSLK